MEMYRWRKQRGVKIETRILLTKRACIWLRQAARPELPFPAIVRALQLQYLYVFVIRYDFIGLLAVMSPKQVIPDTYEPIVKQWMSEGLSHKQIKANLERDLQRTIPRETIHRRLIRWNLRTYRITKNDAAFEARIRELCREAKMHDKEMLDRLRAEGFGNVSMRSLRRRRIDQGLMKRRPNGSRSRNVALDKQPAEQGADALSQSLEASIRTVYAETDLPYVMAQEQPLEAMHAATQQIDPSLR